MASAVQLGWLRAELTGKRHDNVMTDIRTMLLALGRDVLSFQGIYRDALNREKPCFNLPKDLTVTLVTGYSIPMRHAVVTRLEELEAKQAPRLPTHAEALRLYADSLDQLALAAPKVELVDTYVEAGDTIPLREAVKRIGVKGRASVAQLVADKALICNHRGAPLVQTAAFADEATSRSKPASPPRSLSG